MKKFIIIIIVGLFSCYLFTTYHSKERIQLNEDFVTNAYYGDYIALKNNLEEGASLNYELYLKEDSREYNGVIFNALHAAASSGNEDSINFLIDKGLHVDYPTPNGWTSLFIATRDGNAEAAKLLIYRGANVNVETDLKATPLMMAITQKFPSEKSRIELIDYLIKKGANPNTCNVYGYSSIFYAAIKQQDDILKLLTQDNQEIDINQLKLALDWLTKHKRENSPSAILLRKKLIEIGK